MSEDCSIPTSDAMPYVSLQLSSRLTKVCHRAARPTLDAIQSLCDNAKPQAVRQMAAYIREYLFDPDLDFDGIIASARCPDVDPTTIARRFTQHAGEPPMRYVEGQRREVARALLGVADFKVIQVAQLTGFPSPAAFWRAMSRSPVEDPCRRRLIEHHHEVGQSSGGLADRLVEHLAFELNGPGFHALLSTLLRRFGHDG